MPLHRSAVTEEGAERQGNRADINCHNRHSAEGFGDKLRVKAFVCGIKQVRRQQKSYACTDAVADVLCKRSAHYMLKKQRDEQVEKTRLQIRTCRDMGLDKQLIEKLTDEIYREGDPC